jgi:hypothetical protein
MKKLMIVLGAVVVLGIGEYTVGGGLQQVKWQIQRWQAMREAKLHAGVGFTLPMPKGPENAKVKLTMFVDSHNSCHASKVDGMSKMMEPYEDRVRVVFRDSTTPGAQRDLAGQAVGCSITGMVNGLTEMKVPWAKRPLIMQGPLGENMKPDDYTKLLTWALTDEGQKSMADQRAKAEPERQRRAKIEAEKAKKAEAAKAAAAKAGAGAPANGPASTSAPASVPAPASGPASASAPASGQGSASAPASVPAPAGGK